MAKRPTKLKSPTPVEAIKHKDRRKNIPTEELRDFIADDEAKPKTMLYGDRRRCARAAAARGVRLLPQRT